MGGRRLIERESFGHVRHQLFGVDQPGEFDKALAIGHHGHALDADTARLGLRPGGVVNVEQRHQHATITHHLQRLADMVAADGVEHKIDIADLFDEVALGVVDDVVGAERGTKSSLFGLAVAMT